MKVIETTMTCDTSMRHFAGHASLRRLLQMVVVAFVLLAGPAIAPFDARAVFAQDVIDRHKEYNLKAVFLYSFARYITWAKPTARQGDFKVGILGRSPITERIQQIAQKRDLAGRKIAVQTVQTDDSLSDYHLLFVSNEISTKDATGAIGQISRGTVVVGERDELFDAGASIIFFVDGTSVRFELNRQNLKNKDVQLDAKLLQLSRSRR